MFHYELKKYRYSIDFQKTDIDPSLLFAAQLQSASVSAGANGALWLADITRQTQNHYQTGETDSQWGYNSRVMMMLLVFDISSAWITEIFGRFMALSSA